MFVVSAMGAAFLKLYLIEILLSLPLLCFVVAVW